MTKKAFTLVELIVVITILAVLATVAFISFQGYGQSARDSTRLSDMKSMEKILDLSKLTNNRYPTPVDSTSVTYSGSVAWTQGVFGQTAYTSNASMSNVPVDPVTALEYPYSVTANGQEYQLASVLENPAASMISPTTYAGTQEAQVYVKGNYNGTFLKVKRGTTTYLLGVPSILTSDIISSQLLEDIITNKRLVYNGHKNLPASFSGSIYKTDGGFDFGGAPYVASDVILFVGDTNDLETDPALRVALLDKLQASYSGSVIKDVSIISELLSVDSSSAGASSNYVAKAMNNSLKTSIVIKDVVKVEAEEEVVLTCPSDPTPENYFDFNVGTNTITGYPQGGKGSPDVYDIVIPCTIGGVDVLHIGAGSFALEQLTSVVIPDSVISIGDQAFNDNQITSVTLGNSLTSIGSAAFYASPITDLTIPNSVISIGELSFSNNELTTLIIPNNVTSIGDQAFEFNQLTSVTIGNSVVSIGDYAFNDNSLASVIIPNSVTSIGDYAFEYNQLESVTLGNSVITIGEYAFNDNPLISITIPNSVTSIGGYAFQTNQLASVTLGNSVTTIGDYAFSNNPLPSVTLPNSVTTIGDYAFQISQLTSITFPVGITSIGDGAFYFNQINSITIPDGITSIGISAFRSNNLTSVTIPSGITSIGDYAFLNNNLEANTIVIMCGLPTFGLQVFDNNGSGGATDIANPVSCTVAP